MRKFIVNILFLVKFCLIYFDYIFYWEVTCIASYIIIYNTPITLTPYLTPFILCTVLYTYLLSHILSILSTISRIPYPSYIHILYYTSLNHIHISYILSKHIHILYHTFITTETHTLIILCKMLIVCVIELLVGKHVPGGFARSPSPSTAWIGKYTWWNPSFVSFFFLLFCIFLFDKSFYLNSSTLYAS